MPLLDLLERPDTQQDALRVLGNLASNAVDSRAEETKRLLHDLGAFPRVLPLIHSQRDLIALQTRVPTDRTLAFVEDEVASNADPRDAEQALRSKTRALIAWNVALPSLLLAGFGAAIWFVRRSQKRAFLASLNR